MTKNAKILQRKKIQIFAKNCYLFIPRLQEEPSALKKEHPALQNIKFLFHFFLLFLGSFLPSWMRIRIQATKIHADPDPQLCFRHCVSRMVHTLFFIVQDNCSLPGVRWPIGVRQRPNLRAGPQHRGGVPVQATQPAAHQTALRERCQSQKVSRKLNMLEHFFHFFHFFL